MTNSLNYNFVNTSIEHPKGVNNNRVSKCPSVLRAKQGDENELASSEGVCQTQLFRHYFTPPLRGFAPPPLFFATQKAEEDLHLLTPSTPVTFACGKPSVLLPRSGQGEWHEEPKGLDKSIQFDSPLRGFAPPPLFFLRLKNRGGLSTPFFISKSQNTPFCNPPQTGSST